MDMFDRLPDPYHADERAVHAMAGGGAAMPAIRAAMTAQHAAFFAGLPYVAVGSADAGGWPNAVILTGAPGFVRAADPVTLVIEADGHGLRAGQDVGILGIDFATRRRNRANGRVADVSATGVTVAVSQSFGNCPKYIQRRIVRPGPGSARPIERLDGLDDQARSLIGGADTFFVASRSRAGAGPAGGADISHRGGRPGFVRIDGDTLHVPDFTGNRYYNTLGNLLGHNRSALLFVDFEQGDLLHLQGEAEVDWTNDAARGIKGTERSWRFRVVRAERRPGALPLRWSLVDASPYTLLTGVWNGASAGAMCKAVDHGEAFQ